MKKLLYLMLILSFVLTGLNAQDEEEKKFGISFSGFVKNDFILDSRQIVAAREGHFLLFPTDELIDPDGNDINSQGTFNYLAIQSRLTGKITGPDAFGAKTSGVIEGAFFGQNEGNINSFRLRHAFLKLNWSTTEVILGQYWHLMFDKDCFPGTVSFNTGVPFQFFSRNPQIRIRQEVGPLALTGMVATQLDFASPGGPTVLRNALLPDLGGQISYSNEVIHTGITAGYKQLRPRISTDNGYQTKETVGGIAGQAFIKITTAPLTYKVEVLYGQNTFNGLMLGGFAVNSITDPVRDYRSYTTLNTMSIWGDIHTNGKKIQAGLFMGYSKNLGTSDEMDANVMDMFLDAQYTRGHNIDYVYRLSPRFIYNSGKVRFAFEYEHTGAGYAEKINGVYNLDENGIAQNPHLVINHRILVAVFYFF